LDFVGVENGELVLGQGFGGEEVEGASGGVAEQCVQDRQVVTEGFAGGGAGDDDNILALQGRRDGLGLMGEELLDALSADGVL
jgi:hypothetical protein